MDRRIGVLVGLLGAATLVACGDDVGGSGDAGPDAAVNGGGHIVPPGKIDSGTPTGKADAGKDSGRQGNMDAGQDSGMDAGRDASGDDDAGGGSGSCGDGVIDPGEDCDPGLQACCNSTCTDVRSFGAVCRSASGACDVTEICNGTSAACPNDVVAPNTVVCRADAGECDVEETCDGATKACPSDVFEDELTACGSSDATACDAADSCDASGSCVDRVDDNATVCRADAGECDVEDTCDGSAKACPSDVFEAEFTACGDSDATDCDAADSCDASGSCVDRVDDDATLCRFAGEETCDAAEFCDGSAKACPTDLSLPEFTVCGELITTGVCDAQDSCDDSGNCIDRVETNSVVCRADVGECDVEEKCDGSTKACPSDAFELEFTSCGSSDDTDCDAADSCDAAGSCVDRVDANTVVCRTDAGECDVEETCDGSTAACPADVFEDELTACGDADATDCDAADSCDASGACVDRVDANSVVCRVDAGECDVEETCDGSTTACPSDVFEAELTACGDADATDCDAADSCDASGSCVDRVDANTVVCRAATDACDVVENCDGSTNACPTDTVLLLDFATDPDNCGSCGNVCSSGYCVEGTCAGLVFVTSSVLQPGTAYDGTTSPNTFLGLGDGDTVCNELAAAQAMPGTYTVWLSINGKNAGDRVADQPYVLPDGTLVAKSLSELVDGAIDHAINLNESSGTVASPAVWTGTMSDGTDTGITCSDWLDGSNASQGRVGFPANSDAGWTDLNLNFFCSNSLHVYCFQDAPGP